MVDIRTSKSAYQVLPRFATLTDAIHLELLLENLFLVRKEDIQRAFEVDRTLYTVFGSNPVSDCMSRLHVM